MKGNKDRLITRNHPRARPLLRLMLGHARNLETQSLSKKTEVELVVFGPILPRNARFRRFRPRKHVPACVCKFTMSLARHIYICLLASSKCGRDMHYTGHQILKPRASGKLRSPMITRLNCLPHHVSEVQKRQKHVPASPHMWNVMVLFSCTSCVILSPSTFNPLQNPCPKRLENKWRRLP